MQKNIWKRKPEKLLVEVAELVSEEKLSQSQL